MANRPRLQFSLRTSLGVPVALIFLASAGFALYATYTGGRTAINGVADHLHVDLTERVSEHVHRFLRLPEAVVTMNALGIPSLYANPGALERRFWEQTGAFPALSSVYFGNSAGGLVNAGREVGLTTRYVIATDNFEAGPFRKYHVDERGQRGAQLEMVPSFDARTRPWYRAAQEAGTTSNPTWSEPYVLFTGQDMAVAVSAPVYNESGALLGVTAVDVFLSGLSEYLRGVRVGESGFAFIMDASGRYVASSLPGVLWASLSTQAPDAAQPTGPASAGVRRLHATESPDPLIAAAARRALEVARNGESVSVIAEGNRALMRAVPVNVVGAEDWTIVVVLPEADFAGHLYAAMASARRVLAVSLLAALVLAMVVAGVVATPVVQLHAAMHALRADEDARVAVETIPIIELREVASAFNAMADQLRTTIGLLNADIQERTAVEALLRERESALQASVETNKTLLKELQHRIKNSMMMILSLIRLERNRYQGESTCAALAGIENRVAVLTNLYHLMHEEGIGPVRIDRFLTMVCDSLSAVFYVTDPSIVVRTALDEIQLDSSRASAVGLIVNELVTNAYKHAFSNRAEGEVRVQLRSLDTEWFELTVADNGVGLSGSAARTQSGDGFGLGMVSLLTEQMRGTLVVRHEEGTAFVIRIPVGTEPR